MSMEERVAKLEALVADLTNRLAAVSDQAVWRDNYRLPDNASPPSRRRHSHGFVASGSVCAEDRNVADTPLRHLLSHRLDQDWRAGPRLGSKYLGGNPKAWLRGGAMLTANGDTPEVALFQIWADEATGKPTRKMPPDDGQVIGRIYDGYWFQNRDGAWDASGRTVDVLWRYQRGLHIAATDDEQRDPHLTAWFQPATRPVSDGDTGWLMGFTKENGQGEVSRRIKTAPIGELRPGRRVLYIDP